MTVTMLMRILMHKIGFLVKLLQWWTIENHQDPFYVVNEVTLTGQKPSLKFC